MAFNFHVFGVPDEIDDVIDDVRSSSTKLNCFRWNAFGFYQFMQISKCHEQVSQSIIEVSLGGV